MRRAQRHEPPQTWLGARARRSLPGPVESAFRFFLATIIKQRAITHDIQLGLQIFDFESETVLGFLQVGGSSVFAIVGVLKLQETCVELPSDEKEF